MALFLKHAIFVNRAPFENLELDFKESGVNVLSAINGKGKTTILSHIVDAFHELARNNFANEFRGVEKDYYRFSSPLDEIKNGELSAVYFRFMNDSQIWDYVDVRNTCTKEQYDRILPDSIISYNDIKNSLLKSGNIKKWSREATRENIKSIFNNNLITYFPSYRYEEPGYLTDPYKIELSFKKDLQLNGYLPNEIEVVSDLHELANWLMDIVLDYHLYKSSDTISLRSNFNDILSQTLSGKIHGKCRIGIGPRINSGSRVSVVQDKPDKKIDEIYPTLFNISSGEAAVLCMFGELLHQADKIGKLLDVSGIVLIDEVDKHLHIKLQKEILPKLFVLYPNIQFIVSSHSPFLSMGLAEKAKERSQIIDLDNNGLVCEPTSNDLYKEVYEMMITENQRFADKYNNLLSKINEQNKTIVITEGKTDIKHIIKAKEKLGITDVDFATIESENQPDGDSNLYALLEQVSKVNKQYKVIGVFDRDIEGTVKKIEGQGQRYKEFGNGVYAFCIPVPPQRKLTNQEKISIEYLYSDDEVKTILDNGCRLFFGTEFKEHSLWHKTENLTLALPKGRGEDKIIENNGGQAVYDNDENNYLAKKDDFAEAIAHDRISISDESWQNFTPIFELIREIISK